MRKFNHISRPAGKKRFRFRVLLIFTVFLYLLSQATDVLAASDYPSTSSVKVLTCYNNDGSHAHTESCYSDGIDVSQVKQLEYGVTPGYVDTPGTVVNMFDYWGSTRYANDLDQTDWNSGINNGHELKFRQTNGGTVTNQYTNSSKRLTDMVENRLGSDGYPVLTSWVLADAAKSGNKTDVANKGSLQYLFDPNYANDGKASFSNVKGLFQTNSEGYHYYNSQENYAYLDEKNNMFDLYDCWGVWPNTTANASGTKGQFFPFNTYASAANEVANSRNLNHYFGMAMTTRFIQQFGGYTNGSKTNGTHFRFSGDDDVWIFIDGVLVGDLGGIRNEVSIDIDFTNGQIEINEIRGTEHTEANNKSYTSLYDLYVSALGQEAADKYFTTVTGSDGKTYKTYADNTTHTLKFFYLERGNFDSNLLLEFNMNDVPETSIYKVDQYGNPLAGAQFAVYSASDSASGNTNGDEAHYTYTTDSGNTVSSDTVDDLINNKPSAVASNGVITLSDGQTITPKLTVETDSAGKATFVDSDGVRYGPDELENLLGKKFILREIKVPAGYRSSADTICMYFENHILQCADPYSSGVWASPNALITAPSVLSIASDSASTAAAMTSSALTDDKKAVSYFTVGDSNTQQGTLFAVVLKRNGADRDATSLSNLNFNTWSPVSGNDIDGYTVATWGEGGQYATQMDAVLAIAKNEKHVFQNQSGAMQLTYEDLPGDITRYYSYIYETNGKVNATEPQYLVAYYWTSGDLADATTSNTVRINSHENTISGTANGTSAFNVMWGSTIEVPDFENRLYIQKRDTETNPVSGAGFSIYPVSEDSDGAISYTGYAPGDTTKSSPVKIYLGETDANNAGKASLKSHDATPGLTYQVQTNGNIAVYSEGEVVYIIPGRLSEDAPDTGNYGGKLGSSVQYFGLLTEGCYMVREVSVPDGYLLNPTETKVLVTTEGVFANAGTTTDGVDVGNGVGYLTKTLDVFSSEGSIDETLTWILSALRVNTNENEQSFSGFSLGNTATYAKHSPADKAGYGDDTTTDISQALVTYLVFDRSAENTLYDYRPSLVQSARSSGSSVTYTPVNGTSSTTVTLAQGNPATGAGEGTLGLYTDEGWTALEIYQDSSLGSQLTSSETYYTTLGNKNLRNLFSNSTYILYTDEIKADLEIEKVGEKLDGSGTKPLEGVKFTLQNTKTGEYYYSQTVDGETETGFKAYNEASAAVFEQTTGEDGKIHFTDLPEGDYLLKEVLVPDENYTAISDQVVHVGPTTLKDGSVTYVTMSDFVPQRVESSTAAFAYGVTIEDPLNRPTEVTLLKTDPDGNALSGAEFVLYTKSGEENRYYQETTEDDNTTVSWTTEESQASKMTSDKTGMITFKDLRPGTYYLKETQAPDGYKLDSEEKVFKLTYTLSADADAGDADGTFSVEAVSGKLFEAASDGTLELSMKNVKIYELPISGSFGTLYFYLLGCLVMGFALFLYAKSLKGEKKSS